MVSKVQLQEHQLDMGCLIGWYMVVPKTCLHLRRTILGASLEYDQPIFLELQSIIGPCNTIIEEQ